MYRHNKITIHCMEIDIRGREMEASIFRHLACYEGIDFGICSELQH